MNDIDNRARNSWPFYNGEDELNKGSGEMVEEDPYFGFSAKTPDREEGMPTEITLNFKVSVEKYDTEPYGMGYDVSVDGHQIGCVSQMDYMDIDGTAGYHYNGKMFKSLAKAVYMMLMDWESNTRRQLR